MLEDSLMQMVGIPRSYILILCHPYSNDPDSSIKRAVKITKELRRCGFCVFSPIMHTDYYDKYWKEINSTFEENYYEWDRKLYDSINPKAMVFTNDWKESKGCREEMDYANDHGIPIVLLKEGL